jgi:uncharacterized protein YkwD
MEAMPSRPRNGAVLGALILFLAPAGLAGAPGRRCPPPVAMLDPWPEAWEERENALVEEINRVRSEGAVCRRIALPPVAPLDIHTELRQAARRQTRYMALHHDWDHSVAGCEATTWVDTARYRWTSFGQNLALRGRRDSAARVVASWIASREGHCETLMSRKWTSVGVAYVRDGSIHLWTANFGNR